MEYTLLAGDDIGGNLDFLGEIVKDKLKSKEGWAIVGYNEAKEIKTIGVFVYNQAQPDALELSYIYTIPEERENGWAMELLYFARDTFRPLGFNRIICCPVGIEDDILDITIFLSLAGFEPADADMHMYRYSRSNLLGAKVMKPYFEFEGGNFAKLSRDEIRYYINSSDVRIPVRMRDNMLRNCNPQKSVFAIRENRIVGAVLLVDEANDNEISILNLYIDPSWSKKQNILAMLAQAIKAAPPTVEYINFAIENDNIMDLYRYVFGEPDEDDMIQCYQWRLI